MAKDSLDEFYKNLDKEYGKSPQDKNIEYVVSLIKQRVKPDGTVDDDIPVGIWNGECVINFRKLLNYEEEI